MSDQRAAAYRVLQRTKKYWKSIFLDMIDVVVVNSYLLFSAWLAQNPAALDRPRNYDHEEFRIQLIHQLCKITPDAPPPAYHPPGAPQHPALQAVPHLPKYSGQRRNCHYCFITDHIERKCSSQCSLCGPSFHTNHRNCFYKYHQ